MTDERDQDEERRALAAEHALRLLTGEDQRRARALESSDPVFASEVARWRGRSASLFVEIEPAAPRRQAWERIERATNVGTPGSNVVILRRRVGFWRAATGAMTALAAALAFLVVVQPRAVFPPPPPAVQAPAAAPDPARQSPPWATKHHQLGAIGPLADARRAPRAWTPSGPFRGPITVQSPR